MKFTLTAIIEIVTAAIKEIPAAKPSNPSIIFITLINPITHNIVNGTEINIGK